MRSAKIFLLRNVQLSSSGWYKPIALEKAGLCSEGLQFYRSNQNDYEIIEEKNNILQKNKILKILKKTTLHNRIGQFGAVVDKYLQEDLNYLPHF